ncbi:MAG: hypothetical protein Q4E61_02835 [Alphaproteobacteria bacterium]|nr:hypothetical protein [Alphaproteobacteria bacterium]
MNKYNFYYDIVKEAQNSKYRKAIVNNTQVNLDLCKYFLTENITLVNANEKHIYPIVEQLKCDGENIEITIREDHIDDILEYLTVKMK